MRSALDGLLQRKSWPALLLILIGSIAASSRHAAAEDKPIRIREYRDTQPTIDLVDSVRVLSEDKARELEEEIKTAYVKLSPAVVRIWKHDDGGRTFTENGLVAVGGVSGVIVDPAGLILTCSHHGLAPGTAVTIELADGKRVAGKTLGRFRLDDLQPGDVAPDIGLATITQSGDYRAATLHKGEPPVAGRICLAIGYPGTLRPGRPPLLRAGRILPGFPGWSRLEATTTRESGDSGGPLFDLRGQVLGVTVGGDNVACFQSLEPLKTYRDRLEAGEIVSAPQAGVRAMRARPSQPAAFAPALDIEDRVLQVQRSLIRILDGGHEVAAGLIVDADGWAITKASLVGSREQWSCRTFFSRDGQMIVKGRVVAASAEHDVALLKLAAGDLPAARWAQKLPTVGTFVFSILGGSQGPLQAAIVGAETCPELARANDIPQIPISVQLNAAGAPTVKEAGANNAEFDAYKELLEPGDVITHLDNIPTPTGEEYGRVIDRLLYAPDANGMGVDYNRPARGSFAGDWVRVGIRRGSVETTVRIPKIHSTTRGALAWHSHPLSLRRESFPSVFSHDFSLRPEQCGGPVVNLAGEVVGLNIARADTTRTLAIPADVLQTVIKELREQAEESSN